MPSVQRKPSEVTDDYWVFMNRKVDGFPAHSLRGGKWMVFVPANQLDEVWDQIKIATEEGRLGAQSKSSTARPNPRATDNNKAIMVYTYDGDDEADVWRVREELRQLGIIQKLYWKPDEATREGVYSEGGRTRVWRYSG